MIRSKDGVVPRALLHLWRISEHAELSGLGGEFSSGRWHTAETEKRIVYLTEATATSILEILVNLQAREGLFPSTYQLLGVSTDRPVAIAYPERKEHSDLPMPEKAETQRLGDRWIESQETAIAKVPSMIAPYTWNYLLNPKHPDAAHVKITSQRRLPFDPRLFQIRS